MKKIILLQIMKTAGFILAEPNMVVSIEPEANIVQNIVKDNLGSLEVMVKKGQSPHTYEPKPSQMVSLSSADLYFSVGVEFENSWLPKFKAQNRNLNIIDISKGVERIGGNPHIWLSPKSLKVMAENVSKALIDFDENQSGSYRAKSKRLYRETR